MNRTWLWIVLAVVVVAGTFFRVEHIDRRLFWQDETYTALRVSGHSDPEFRAIFNESVYPTSAIARFQSYDPQRGVTGTLRGLATEEPQHAPLFYILDHYWAAVFGSSIPALRALALIFGLLAIAAFAWFAFELSGNLGVAIAAASLMAVSPFFINYSGQAREYSLWAFMISLTSALLLRALRTEKNAWWLAYAVVLLLSLYSDLLMLCALISHALYVVIVRRSAFPRFAIAGGAPALLFAPWVAICAMHARRIALEQSWGFTAYPLKMFVEKWLFNLGAVLFDAEYAGMRWAILAAVALAVVFAAAIYVVRGERPSTVWFLTTLGGVIACQQILTDIVTHGHESTTARYLMPLWIALLAAVALFFGARFARTDGRTNWGWVSAFCAVLALESWSSAVNSSAVVWWDNNDNTPSTTMAADINASGSAPLVLSEGYWAEVLVMSHYVEPSTQFLLFTNAPPERLPDVSDAFLLDPSQKTLGELRHSVQFSLVPLPIAPLGTQGMLAFHATLEASGVKRQDQWQQQVAFLFRLVPRVAQR